MWCPVPAGWAQPCCPRTPRSLSRGVPVATRGSLLPQGPCHSESLLPWGICPLPLGSAPLWGSLPPWGICPSPLGSLPTLGSLSPWEYLLPPTSLTHQGACHPRVLAPLEGSCHPRVPTSLRCPSHVGSLRFSGVPEGLCPP